MRIACMCFARLTDKHRPPRYAVLINQGKLRHDNRRILTPIGGALEWYESGHRHLTRLGAHNFESGTDLRFTIDDSQIPAVVHWFGRRSKLGRERSVLREFREEMGAETALLDQATLQSVRERFAGFSLFKGMTTRRQVRLPSLYIIEVYDITVDDGTLHLLHRATRHRSRLLYFVTQTEILQGAAADGTPIDPICETLLSPVDRLS